MSGARGMEDAVHDITGQNGSESFKDAWKNLGASVVDTVSDPYGTAVRAIGDELEAARNNPTHWLGEKAFDADGFFEMGEVGAAPHADVLAGIYHLT